MSMQITSVEVARLEALEPAEMFSWEQAPQTGYWLRSAAPRWSSSFFQVFVTGSQDGSPDYDFYDFGASTDCACCMHMLPHSLALHVAGHRPQGLPSAI